MKEQLKLLKGSKLYKTMDEAIGMLRHMMLTSNSSWSYEKIFFIDMLTRIVLVQGCYMEIKKVAEDYKVKLADFPNDRIDDIFEGQVFYGDIDPND